MSTFLVTGGCGFIGSHLCDALLARGDTVRVLDDLSSGHRHNLSDGVELIEGDVASPRCIGTALAGVDGCFHLAAIASVQRATRDRAGTHRTNVTGTITILDQVKRLARPSAIPVVYASSAAVYGDGAVMPLAETCSPRPVSAYGAGKLACERQARAATFAHAIPTIGMRFFNVFGPRQNPASPYSGVISIFCDRIARGLPVDIFGDGMQTRDFVFVGDVVAALLRAMAMRPAGGPVFNVCTGRATTVLDLAGMIAGLSGTSARMRFGEARPGDIRHSIGSPDKARAVLDLAEPVGLEQGLAQVLEWNDAGRVLAGPRGPVPHGARSIGPGVRGGGLSAERGQLRGEVRLAIQKGSRQRSGVHTPPRHALPAPGNVRRHHGQHRRPIRSEQAVSCPPETVRETAGPRLAVDP